MGNPTLELAKLTHISEMLAWNLRFYVAIPFQMYMEDTYQGLRGTTHVVLCVTLYSLCCVCLSAYGSASGRLGWLEMECHWTLHTCLIEAEGSTLGIAQ